MGKYFYNIERILNPEIITLNNYKSQKHCYFVNMLILIVKQYIYSVKCKKEKLNFVQYVNRINYWYRKKTPHVMVKSIYFTKNGNVMKICK